METKGKIPFSNIEEYIALQPVERRATLEKLRQVIRKAAPGAEEVISYQMPAFRFHGMLVFFAGAKNHYGLYPTRSGVDNFRDKLKAYKILPGTIQFPYDKPVPVKLVTEIVKFRVKENLEKELRKKAGKKKGKKK